MQVHHSVIYRNGLGDDEYCELERLLKARGFEPAYRFAFVWEAWVRSIDAKRVRALLGHPRR